MVRILMSVQCVLAKPQPTAVVKTTVKNTFKNKIKKTMRNISNYLTLLLHTGRTRLIFFFKEIHGLGRLEAGMILKDVLLSKCLCVGGRALRPAAFSSSDPPCSFLYSLSERAPVCARVRLCMCTYVHATAQKTQALQVFIPHKSSIHHKDFYFLVCI